jgi:hypothetical protein
MCDSIRKVLDVTVERENGDNVAAQLVDLNALLGTSAAVLSAMWFRKEDARRRVLEVIAETGTKITPALQRDLVNGKCAGYGAAYEYADRLNSGVVHSIDSLRSVLSWLKLEKGTAMPAQG